jgi:F0F1-type ATP synthase assembly protein I
MAKPQRKNPVVVVGEYSALAFILPACIFVGYALGRWLDSKFGTSYLSLVFLLLGILAGFIQIFRVINRTPHQ